MSDILFDTSIVVAHLRHRFDAFGLIGRGDSAFISTTVLGELWHGIRKSASPEHGEALLSRFLERVGFLRLGYGTAEIYGDITANLERRGSMIPINDIWIAAVAVEGGLTLATRDQHFKRVDGLSFLLWE